VKLLYLFLGRKGQSGHPAPQHPLLVELIVSSNHPRCEIGCESVEEVITSYVFLIFILTLVYKGVNECLYSIRFLLLVEVLLL